MSLHVLRFNIMEMFTINTFHNCFPAIFGKGVTSISDIMVSKAQTPVTCNVYAGNRTKPDYLILYFSQFSPGKNHKMCLEQYLNLNWEDCGNLPGGLHF